MLTIRVCLIVICAFLIFVMRRWQTNENKKAEPRKSILLTTKVVNLISAAVIAVSVVGQIIDLTSK